ncbi:MAG: pyridoxamine 5'-phosphate oxidase family protein [Candidatus Omnitrophota bacterium]|jgi:hypothetical protein
MDLKNYFETTHGIGVLSTADASGKTDAAIYARPHILDDGNVALIMRDRLSHHNLESNPHATYLYIEDPAEYTGKRLYLKKIAQEKNTPRIEEMRRRSCRCEQDEDDADRFLVTFKIEKVLPLIGDQGSCCKGTA